MFIQPTATALEKTGMTPVHAQATATGIITSVWVTFLALAVGALTQSVIDGAHNPHDTFKWVTDGHGYGYLVTQIVAPGIRGFLAHRNSVQNAAPPAEGATP